MECLLVSLGWQAGRSIRGMEVAQPDQREGDGSAGLEGSKRGVARLGVEATRPDQEGRRETLPRKEAFILLDLAGMIGSGEREG